jgi:hypothetical protein
VMQVLGHIKLLKQKAFKPVENVCHRLAWVSEARVLKRVLKRQKGEGQAKTLLLACCCQEQTPSDQEMCVTPIYISLTHISFCADITQKKIWKLKQQWCKIPNGLLNLVT